MPIVFYKNIGLTDADTGGSTSTVGEPNVANKSGNIFYSGNWYAARSLDAGLTWDPVSPFTILPSVDGGFCCDQTLIYEQSRDIMVWILQYVEENGTNTLRVAISPGADLGDNSWHWWDFKPEEVNVDWAGEWFDYNHVATSDNFLYVGSNVFNTSPEFFTRSIIFRFPLDALADASTLNYSYYQTSENFSLRCVQGATDTMYFASHNTTSQLRVFSWPESESGVSSVDVDVSAWSAASPYSAPGPDGQNWLGRCDSRITAGAVANGVLTFAWSSNATDSRPQPFVRVVRMDAATKNLLNEPDIWSSSYAYAYPALCPNARGDLGMALFRGGGDFFPGLVVGVRDEDVPGWVLKAARDGTDGPSDGKWGDYVGVLNYSNSGYSWFASGFTLQGGGTQFSVEPRVVQFGYRRS
jgi:hypothetical protein